MNELHEETIEFLSKSGWAPTRKVDVTEYLKAHEEAGCSVPEIVVEFLINFGCLEIILPLEEPIATASKQNLRSRKVHFNGLKAGLGDFCDGVKHYAENVNVNALYPIGELDAPVLLLLDEYGRMYYGMDHGEIYQFGETIFEGLNKIIASRGNIR